MCGWPVRDSIRCTCLYWLDTECFVVLLKCGTTACNHLTSTGNASNRTTKCELTLHSLTSLITLTGILCLPQRGKDSEPVHVWENGTIPKQMLFHSKPTLSRASKRAYLAFQRAKCQYTRKRILSLDVYRNKENCSFDHHLSAICNTTQPICLYYLFNSRIEWHTSIIDSSLVWSIHKAPCVAHSLGKPGFSHSQSQEEIRIVYQRV
jgi:hypothetical protein